MATKSRFTAEDLWRMAEGEVRRELVNGEKTVGDPSGEFSMKGVVQGHRRNTLKSRVEGRFWRGM